MKSKQSNKRLTLVDLYRAIAIFLVAFFHINLIYKGSFNYDWFNISEWDKMGGVNFFFVVSGFMIYYLYSKNFGNAEKAKEFAIKRFIRIYPLYAVFTIIAIATVLVIPQLGTVMPLNEIIKTFLFLPTDTIPLESTWSLKHIVLFYIIFTLVIYKPKIFKPVFVLWIIGTIIFTFMPNLYTDVTLFVFRYHNIEIFIGCVIAYVVRKYDFNVCVARVILTLGVLGYLMIYINNYYLFLNINNMYLYTIFASAIMFGITVVDLNKQRKLNKGLQLYSNASYATYITHSLFANFYVLVLKITGLQPVLGNFISFGLITVLTALSPILVYLWFEMPVNKYLTNLLLKTNKRSDAKRVSTVTR